MKTENINSGFLFKHWFFTLLLAPAISQIISFIALLHSKLMFGLLVMYPIVLIISFVFSIPTYILYGFVYYCLANKSSSILIAKSILIVLTIIGIYITLAIIDGTIALEIALSYSIASILTGLLFKLEFQFENS